jgi:hypothetical protein
LLGWFGKIREVMEGREGKEYRIVKIGMKVREYK